MNVQARLLTIFIIIASLFLFSSVGISFLTNRQAQTVDHLISNTSQALSILNGLVIQLQKTRRYEKEYFIHIGHTSKKARYNRAWNDSMDKVFASLQLLMDDPYKLFDGEDNKVFQNWQQAARFYNSEFKKIIETFSGVRSVGEAAEKASSRYTIKANSSIEDGKNSLNTVFSGVIELEQKKQLELQYTWQKIKIQSGNTINLTFTTSAVAMLILLIVMIYLHRSILGKFHNLIGKAKLMSEGDLSVYFDKTGVAELDTLSMAMEHIKRKLLKSR